MIVKLFYYPFRVINLYTLPEFRSCDSRIRFMNFSIINLPSVLEELRALGEKGEVMGLLHDFIVYIYVLLSILR